MSTPLISIALASYNGERFIRQQLESILNQTVSDIEVVVSDDVSTDGTAQIVLDMSQKGPIKWIPNSQKLGVIKNFEHALRHCVGQYVAFSDQDDVWLPSKLEKSLARMKALEKEHGTELPLLVFTDVKVVDQQLNAISDSYLGFKKLDPNQVELRHLLVENVPTGCTMLMNRALVERVKTIPVGVSMHDVFVSLTAACFGKMGYLNEPTLLYRQHDSNVLGLATKRKWEVLRSTLAVLFRKDAKSSFLNIEISQAKAFLHHFHDQFSPEEQSLLVGFMNIRDKGKLSRMLFLIKNGVFKGYWLRTLNLLMKI